MTAVASFEKGGESAEGRWGFAVALFLSQKQQQIPLDPPFAKGEDKAEATANPLDPPFSKGEDKLKENAPKRP